MFRVFPPMARVRTARVGLLALCILTGSSVLSENRFARAVVGPAPARTSIEVMTETSSPVAGTDVAVPGAQHRDVAERRATVLLYSDDVTTRQAVRRAIGRRASKDTPFIDWNEVATAEAMLLELEAGGVDLLILDGESAKVGGFGLSRQVKDTLYAAPPILLLIGRPQDAWLAAWSQADGVVPFPLRPEDVAETVAALLRSRP